MRGVAVHQKVGEEEEKELKKVMFTKFKKFL